MTNYSHGRCEERVVLERELKKLKLELSLWNETTILYLPKHYDIAVEAVNTAQRHLKWHKNTCDTCKGGAK